MAMSPGARAGLEGAVRFNPDAAADFLAMLSEHPAWVRYKPEDPYGPLALMLFGARFRSVAPGVKVPVAGSPPSPELLGLCAVWNREWLDREFSKAELAEALSEILRALPAATMPDQSSGAVVLYQRERRD